MLTEEGEKQNMKKTNLLAILTLAATPAFLHAQTTSYSDIVGYQTKNVGAGLNSLGLPLLNADIVKTTSGTLSVNVLSLTGETNFGAKLSATEPYYLEVYTGSLKGDRFEVDVAATIAAANGAVVLNSSSANNTVLLNSVGTGLDAATVAIRKHITIEQIASMASTAFVKADSIASSDAIGIVEGGALVYYNNRANGTWRRAGDSADYSKKAVPPGAGILIKKVSGSSTTVTQTGSVRDNDFARPYSVGLQLHASAFPIDNSPSGLGATPGSGASDWTAGTTALGDYFGVVESGALVKYTLRTDGQVVRPGNSSNFAGSSIFDSSSARLIKRAKANTDVVEVDPVSN
jgi:hypothetical protein